MGDAAGTGSGVRARPRPARNSAAPEASREQGTISVRRASYGAEHHSEERVSVPLFSTHPARVRVSGGVTRSLGEFEFARIDVSVELPCYPEVSEIERATEIASQIVARKIEEQDAMLDESPPPATPTVDNFGDSPIRRAIIG